MNPTTNTSLTVIGDVALAPSTPELLAAFGDFMRLDVADGAASPATIRTYHTHVKAFVAWCAMRNVNPACITENDLKEWRAELGTQYARNSIAAKLGAVRRFYAMLQARGYRADNPAQGLKAPKDKTGRKTRIEQRYLRLTDAARVLALPNATTTTGKRDRAILAVFIYNGARVSEVAALDVADVDLERGEIAIRHGKGDKARTLLIEHDTADAVREWLAARVDLVGENECALFVALNHDPHERGRRITARAIRSLVDNYLTRADCKRTGVSCHSLRHTFATLALAGGAELLAISGALGHTSVETTQVYAKIVNERAKNPARFVAEILGTLPK